MSPLGHVPPMEEHLTAIRGADEPVPLPTNDLHNPPQRRPTARIWLALFARTLRLGASRARRRWLVAHGIPFSLPVAKGFDPACLASGYDQGGLRVVMARQRSRNRAAVGAGPWPSDTHRGLRTIRRRHPGPRVADLAAGWPTFPLCDRPLRANRRRLS